MSTKINSTVSRAHVFSPKEEGWSEQVSLYLNDAIQGYRVDENGVKTKVDDVNYISVFIGDVTKALCAADAQVAAFLSAKPKEDKIKLIPMLVNNAEIEFEREFVEADEEYHTNVTKIHVSSDIKPLITNALTSLFSF